MDTCFFFCLRTSLSGTKDSKTIDTRFMLFCQNLLHLCLHMLRFFQIWHRKLPCSFRSQKAIYGDRFKYTSAQLLCLVLLCLCSSQKEIPKWHVVSVQPPPPPLPIQSFYGHFLQNQQFSATCALYFLILYIKYGFKILNKDPTALSVSALSKEQIQKYTCRGEGAVVSVQSPSMSS